MRLSWYLPLLLAAFLGLGHPATAQAPRKDPAPASGADTPLAFQPLRSRADFKELLATVAKPAKTTK
jgi:hypothetical protein